MYVFLLTQIQVVVFFIILNSHISICLVAAVLGLWIALGPAVSQQQGETRHTICSDLRPDCS